MGWTNSHLHAFTVGDARCGMCFDEHLEREIDEQTVTVLRALRGHTRFTYEYDFGDGWGHTITVEAELRTTHALKFALFLPVKTPVRPRTLADQVASSISSRRWPTSSTKSMRITSAGTTATPSIALRFISSRSMPHFRRSDEAPAGDRRSGSEVTRPRAIVVSQIFVFHVQTCSYRVTRSTKMRVPTLPGNARCLRASNLVPYGSIRLIPFGHLGT